MHHAMTESLLARENVLYRGSGGVSAGNRSHHFVPGFLDAETGVIYRSCYATGQPAPFHLLDGLPEHLVLARSIAGKPTQVKCSVVSGFIRACRFYTRDEAATLVSGMRLAA